MTYARLIRPALLIALLLCVAALAAGCGGSSSDSNDKEQGRSKEQKQEPQARAEKGPGPRVHADPPLLNKALYTELQMKEQVRKAYLNTQSLYTDNSRQYGETKDVISYLGRNGIVAKSLKGAEDCLSFQNSLAVGVWAQGDELNLCVTSPEDASPIFYRDDMGAVTQS